VQDFPAIYCEMLLHSSIKLLESSQTCVEGHMVPRGFSESVCQYMFVWLVGWLFILL